MAPTAIAETDHHDAVLRVGELEPNLESWDDVTAAQAGDNAAFGRLYRDHYDVVLRFIGSRVHDRQLAEDLASETFLRAFRRINTVSYRGENIRAWFMTIARNIIIDHIKSARVSREIVVEGPERTDSAASAESDVIERWMEERVARAITQLPEHQRRCVALRFGQGLSTRETAHLMGLNETAVKSLQHRATRRLARLLHEDAA
jgi:RNA polymerase sigma-70 factor (ECF subfamily)